MQTTTTDTGFVITNPYTAQTTVPVVELQLLLLAAVACFVVGMLLAEKTTLRRILNGTDQTINTLFDRRTAETI